MVHGVLSLWSGSTQGNVDVLDLGEFMEFLKRLLSSQTGLLVTAK